MRVLHREYPLTGSIGEDGEIRSNGQAIVVSPRTDAVTVLHAYRPFLAYYPTFLSQAEAQHMIGIARPLLERSRMGGGGTIDYGSNGRTSSSAPITKSHDDIVRRIEERAAYLTGFPVDNIERLQVVRYLPGQQFDAHWDAFGPFNKGERDIALGDGYNRVFTIFCYLSDAPTCTAPEDPDHRGDLNGCTLFPLLSLAVPPSAGGAVFWTNTDESLRIHHGAVHQGFPVCCGEKWGLNIWIHARDLWTFAQCMDKLRQHVRPRDRSGARKCLSFSAIILLIYLINIYLIFISTYFDPHPHIRRRNSDTPRCPPPRECN